MFKNVLKRYCPSEFARRPRTLDMYSKFKATEFHQFLLYKGPIVMFDILDKGCINIFYSCITHTDGVIFNSNAYGTQFQEKPRSCDASPNNYQVNTRNCRPVHNYQEGNMRSYSA